MNTSSANPAERLNPASLDLLCRVGVIVIGRNEGERLKRCLESVKPSGVHVVYVDSDSADGSVVLAHDHGADVVQMDLSKPFCAARARNEGYARLLACYPETRFVQFVDGDCEIAPGWLDAACSELASRPELGIIAGRLKERFAAKSIYNRIGELEWNDANAGPVEAVGGIFMARCEAFEAVDGFNSSLVSGEEPELCHRLRKAGWGIRRLDEFMAWHDLAMTSFMQWWTRQTRNGYGSKLVGERFGLSMFKQNNRRVLLWAVWLGASPLAAAVAGLAFGSAAGFLALSVLLSIWPMQVLRVTLRTARKGHPLSFSLAYGFFAMAAYLPQMAGQARCIADLRRQHGFRLIEYKTGRPSSGHSQNEALNTKPGTLT